MTAFRTMFATLHADANMAEAAEFRRPPFTWAPVRVIRVQPSQDFGTGRAAGLFVDMLASATPDRPAKGDEVRLAGETYRVDDCDPDDLGLSYRLTLADLN